MTMAAMMAFSFVTPASAQPFEVRVDDDYCDGCPNDGHTWGYDAFAKIQDGIDAVVSSGTVHVGAGTYVENIDFSGKAITLRSIDPNDPDVVAATIIDGNQAGSVVSFSNGEGSDSVLSGMTVRNGNADFRGGGICCEYASPTITNCNISDNKAGSYGGGICCYGSSSSPTITNCTISENMANWDGGGIHCSFSSSIITNCIINGNTTGEHGNGGGIFVEEHSSSTIRNNMITGNSARFGAGISIGGAIIVVSNTITGNNAAQGGGGIFGTGLISENTIEGNTAGDFGGGGILIYSTGSADIMKNFINDNTSSSSGGGILVKSESGCISANIANNVITGNSAGDVGGAISAKSSCTFAHIINNTIVRNYAVNAGGGIHQDLWAETTIVNTILWANGDDLDGCTATYSNIEDGDLGEGNISIDPVFVDPEHGDYHLQADSPCLDGGNNAALPWWLITDFEADPRVCDGKGDGALIVDMGVYEVGDDCYALPPGGSGNYPPPATGDWVITNQTKVWDDTVILKGNLIIENGGSLTFNNVTLVVTSTNGGDSYIEVKKGGALYIYDNDNDPDTTLDASIITAKNQTYLFCSDPGSKLEIKNSEVHHCGHATTAGPHTHGLCVKTDNALIKNNVITHTWSGITIYEASSNTVFGNKFDSVHDYEIHLIRSSNNTIANNIAIGSGMGSGILLEESVNNTIEGNTANSNWSGIELILSNNNRIINNTTNSNLIAGIKLSSSSNNMITGNNARFNTHYSGGGICLEGSSIENTITNNILDSNNHGVHLGMEYAEVTEHNNVITNNTLTSNYVGIYIWYSNHNIVRENNVSANATGICSGSGTGTSTNNVIEGNIVTSNEGNGIVVFQSNDVIVTGNVVTSNSNGIALNNSDNCRIANNNASSNNFDGIAIGGDPVLGDGNNIVNNIAESNDCGISVYGCSPTILNNTIVDNSNYGVSCVDSPSPRIVNNIIWRNGDDLNGCTATYSDISDCDLGTGNISVNPMFADASGGDYHLQSSSLCIDAGTNTGAPSEDIEGNARPQDGDEIGGAVTDMGAYEYVPAPAPAIEADVDFAPNTLNLRSKGKWITCYIELLEGYDVEEINERTVTMLHGEVSVTAEWGDIQNGVLMVKFDRSAVQEILTAGDGVELTVSVSGELMDETPFEGTDTIRVIE